MSGTEFAGVRELARASATGRVTGAALRIVTASIQSSRVLGWWRGRVAAITTRPLHARLRHAGIAVALASIIAIAAAFLQPAHIRPALPVPLEIAPLLIGVLLAAAPNAFARAWRQKKAA